MDPPLVINRSLLLCEKSKYSSITEQYLCLLSNRISNPIIHCISLDKSAFHYILEPAGQAPYLKPRTNWRRGVHYPQSRPHLVDPTCSIQVRGGRGSPDLVGPLPPISALLALQAKSLAAFLLLVEGDIYLFLGFFFFLISSLSLVFLLSSECFTLKIKSSPIEMSQEKSLLFSLSPVTYNP